MARTRNSCNNPIAKVKNKNQSMFCPLPRGGILISANRWNTLTQKVIITNPKCLAEASSQLQMPGDAQSKIRREDGLKIIPATPTAAQVADIGRTMRTAAASPAQDAPTAARVRRRERGEGQGVCRAPSATERINPPCGRNEKQPDNCWKTSRMHLLDIYLWTCSIKLPKCTKKKVTT